MNDIIILFPGSFKPIHCGHINMINRYLEQPNVKSLKLMIGPGIRDGITQEISYQIARILLGNNLKIDIEKVIYPSPVLTAFKFIETAEASTYALASSSKNNDYERVERFAKQHQFGGKYHDKVPKGVEFIVLPIDVLPLTYKGRKDEKNGMNISSTILRQDIINNNFTNFKTNYSGISEDKILVTWYILKKCVRK